jgi:hypothetical protein
MITLSILRIGLEQWRMIVAEVSGVAVGIRALRGECGAFGQPGMGRRPGWRRTSGWSTGTTARGGR